MAVRSTYVIALLIFSWLALAEAAGTENVRFFQVEDPPSKAHQPDDSVTVSVDLQQSLNSISSHFIGVTIDAGLILLNWSTLDFNSKRVQNMAKALTPTYFRLGGSYADGMTYDLGGGQDGQVDKNNGISKVKPFNLTAKEWDAVNKFSETVGWEFIMDINALKRNPDGSWNPDNARQLLKYSADRNYTIAGFELGNEYDVYKQNFNVSVSPSQMAKDVASLQDLLRQFPAYATSFLIGPETVTQLGKYFGEFLADGGYKTVRAASFHQYYFAGFASNVSDFIEIRRMDELIHTLNEVFRLSRLVAPQLPVWLSETSSAWDSGTPNVSDRFVAGFLWLDKLGVCASMGIQSVIRQSFYGGHYSLVNADLNPNPDFWLTVLYKRIIWGAVFNVIARKDIRVYAACANTQFYKPGGVALYALNPNPYPVTLDLPQFSGHPLSVYNLTAGDSVGLLSKYIALNGVKLQLIEDHLPDFVPLTVHGNLPMAPFSFMFVVVEDTMATICLERP